MRDHRREIENRPSACGVCLAQQNLGSGYRYLELEHPDLAASWGALGHRSREGGIGARGDGDRVVAAGHLDQRHAGRGTRQDDHAGCIHAMLADCGAHLVAEGIVADSAEHRRLRPKAYRGDRLVCPLAAGQEGHRRAEQRLAGRGTARALHDHVHVQAAADDYAAHRMLTSSSGATAASSLEGTRD